MNTITELYENSDKWLRLVTLIDFFGTKLCEDVLHAKESFPRDGMKLCNMLKQYQNKMDNYQKEILCPPSGCTNESKFDISLYTRLIKAISKKDYGALADDLRKSRNSLHHVTNKSMSDTAFEDKWRSSCNMLKKHMSKQQMLDLDFHQNVQELKNDKIITIDRFKKTLGLIENQVQGNF